VVTCLLVKIQNKCKNTQFYSSLITRKKIRLNKRGKTHIYAFFKGCSTMSKEKDGLDASLRI
jgi:hypothetical protein